MKTPLKDSNYYFLDIAISPANVSRQLFAKSRITYFTRVDGEIFSVTLTSDGFSAKHRLSTIDFSQRDLHVLFNLLSAKAFCKEAVLSATPEQLKMMIENGPIDPVVALISASLQ